MSVTIYVNGNPVVYGDTSGTLADHTKAGDDTLNASDFGITIYGDAAMIAGHSVGGDDHIVAGGDGDGATAIGDADTISGHGRGGNDTLSASGVTHSNSMVFGDARQMSDHAVGGDDLVLTGRTEYGDAQTLSGHVRCGDDTLIGNGSGQTAVLYGDGATISDHVHCGNDSLTITTQFGGQLMFGDGQTISGHVHCGDDTLTAPSGQWTSSSPLVDTYMYGDGANLADHAHAGNDVLISGKNSNDQMWGDAAVIQPDVIRGENLFVFQPLNGHDQIMDFQAGKDRIELEGFCFKSFQDVASHFQTTPDGVLISFDANDDVLVRGVTAAQLDSGDFILG